MMKKPEYKARKHFGQHFLHDFNIIQKIIQVINPKKEDFMIEIGPGLGAITVPLLEYVNHLHVIEVDREIIPLLQKKIHHLEKLTIHQKDALRFDFHPLAQQQKLRIVGNLPYNISTPLLFHLLEQREIIHDMYFMLQREIVDRIVAQHNTEHYGRLSVVIQYFFQCRKLFTISPQSFSPAPKVYSAFMQLVPYQIAEQPHTTRDIMLFAEVVRLAFNQRRKTIHNSLKSLLDGHAWQALNIDPNLRAENLSVKDYVNITNYLCE